MASESNGKESQGFLGEVHFEPLSSGRVRCVETDHEMPEADKQWYGQSKKCRRALFDLCLAQRKSPLNVFEQSPTARDKVICKLTGDTLNKTEEAVWKHMVGKKFQRKLAQKEAEKVKVQQGGVVPTKQFGDEQKVQAEQDDNRMTLSSSPTMNDEVGSQSTNFEELEFWVPPIGDRWDFDTGHDRWTDAPAHGKGNIKIHDEHQILEDVEGEGRDSTSMSSSGSDGDEMTIRTKRMSINRPGSFGVPKKKRKTEGA